MEYGRYYSINELAIAAELYLSLLDKIDLQFFVQDNLPLNRGEIVKTIQIGRIIKLQKDKIPMTSHPAIHSAIKNKEFYKEKVGEINDSDKRFFTLQLYTDLVFFVDSMIGLICNVYIKTIEIRIAEKKYIEAIKFMTIERQKDEYKYTHPTKFIEKYREYLTKRIKDLKELIEIDNLDFGVELTEVEKLPSVTYQKLNSNLNDKNKEKPNVNESLTSLKLELIDLLSKDRVAEVISKLNLISQTNLINSQEEIVIASSRFYSLKKEKNQNTISVENYNVEKSKILVSILSIINEL